MKRVCATLLAAALVVAAGCESKSTPGGPGATRATDRNPPVGQADETFTLDVPNVATTIKQGEAKQVGIDIRRGTNFGEDVALSFEGVPKGVTIDPAGPAIKKADTGAKFTVKAADDAALGDFTIKVKGTPTKGASATNEFKITVEKK